MENETLRMYMPRCPNCGKHIHLVERRFFDRVILQLMRLHTRRYACSDCGWAGLLSLYSYTEVRLSAYVGFIMNRALHL